MRVLQNEAGRMIGSGLMLMSIAGCVIALAMQRYSGHGDEDEEIIDY